MYGKRNQTHKLKLRCNISNSTTVVQYNYIVVSVAGHETSDHWLVWVRTR